MNNIAQTAKMYSVRFKYDIVEFPTPIFTGISHGLNEDEASKLFIDRNPSVIIVSIEEIKLKN